MAEDSHLYRYEVPFVSFVEPLPPHLQTEAIRDALFHQFARLPTELQLDIVRKCDAPTLWQLMRTTSSLRKEATARFWNHADVWYKVGSGWIGSRKGGYRHISDYQKGFWHSIKQIMFSAERFEWDFEDGKAFANGMSKIQVKVSYFWEMVRNSFPSAERILLDNYSLRGALPAIGENELGDWSILRMLVDGAPKALDVRLVIDGGQNRYPPSDLLGQKQNPVASNRWPGWKLLEERIWRPAVSVLQPGGWDLPDGPLRRYETMNHVADNWALERRYFGAMVLATHTRYSKGDNISCPVDGCDFGAQSKAQWLNHSPLRHRWEEISWASNTPRAVQAFLQYKKAQVDHLKKRYQANWLSIRKDMGVYDSFEWKAYMNAMEKEVQHYLYPSASPVHQEEMSQYMHNGGFSGCFDPTHVYYSPAIRGYDEVPSYEANDDNRTNTLSEVVADGEDSGGPQLDPEQLREVIERHDRFWRRAGFVPRDTRSLEQPS